MPIGEKLSVESGKQIPTTPYKPFIEINNIPGENIYEDRILAKYNSAIFLARDDIYSLIRDGVENGRIPPYKSFKLNLSVGNLPYKLKGFRMNKKGKIIPAYEGIVMEEIRQESQPNEFNVTFSNQSKWFPPEALYGCVVHAIGGHISYGVNGNEREIERSVMKVLEGKEPVKKYVRENSGYIV
jgi:hypothetical protein